MSMRTGRSTSNPTRAAQPKRVIFDPWNSCSTGHQQAENRLLGSASWRIQRTVKLQDQLEDAEGRGGSKIIHNAVTGGTDELVATGVVLNDMPCSAVLGGRGSDQPTLAETLDRFKRKRRKIDSKSGELGVNTEVEAEHGSNRQPREPGDTTPVDQDEEASDERERSAIIQREKQIFRNLTFYINGSTYPLISDYKLKRLLTIHGGRLSLALGRRTVTHVILGVRSDQSKDIKRPAGGGLAAGKIQKEIKTTKSSTVRYVSVDWVLDCLERGRRVPEAAYAPGVGVAGRGQRSAMGISKG